MEINKKVSSFKLSGTSGLQFNLSDYKGRYLVLYFYPKDATPGCTTQGVDFRDTYKKFHKLDTEIFGISRDTLKSHENFKSKFSFPFELLSDEEEKACALFGVIKMKNMYGIQVRGIERSTFVIDPNGKLIKIWRGVKVEGHVEEVFQFVKQHNLT
ncbi:MAG: peroxiredoxin [Candidatus Methylopumilus sp.]|nr:peroxiredoxin [Candidatus Methylopumilus sp.]